MSSFSFVSQMLIPEKGDWPSPTELAVHGAGRRLRPCTPAWPLRAAWPGASVSSPRLPNPSCGHSVLDGEWFYTSHPTRKQTLSESRVTGFSRISSFQNPPVPPWPQQLPFEFPSLRPPLCQGAFPRVWFPGSGTGQT